MATKNLVPRLDNEGKLGLKDTTPQRRWAEVNAVTGAFDTLKTDKLQNLSGSELLKAANDSVTIDYNESTKQYFFSSSGGSGSGSSDKIIEGTSSVEVIEDGINTKVNFVIEGNEKWLINNSGHFLPSVDDTLDIGTSTKRVSNIHLGQGGIKFYNGSNLRQLNLNATGRLQFTNHQDESNNQVYDLLPVTKSVKYATTAPVNLSTVTTIDSSNLSYGDRVLVKNQTTKSENGIYVFDDSSSPKLQRSNDFPAGSSFSNTIVNVLSGSTNQDTLYHSLLHSTGSSEIGTDPQNWSLISEKDFTLTQFDTISSLSDTDSFLVDDGNNGTTRKALLSTIKDFIYSGVSGPVQIDANGNSTLTLPSIANSNLANSHISFTNGTMSTDISLGGTLTIQGTDNEATVTNSAGTFTIGLPNDVTIGQDLTVSRSLTLNGQNKSLSLNSQTIQNLGAPQNNTDAATKLYVDSVAQGLKITNSVKAATTANFTTSAAFTATTIVLANGEGGFNSTNDTFTVDGESLIAGDRLLVKDGVASGGGATSIIPNGIYTVGALNGTTLTLTRASDLTQGDQASSAFVFVFGGNTNLNKGFVCIADSSADTVSTHDLSWSQFSMAGQIGAGNGLVSNGNNLDVNVDGTSILIQSNQLKIGTIPASVLNTSLANHVFLESNLPTTILGENRVGISSLNIADSNNESITTLADGDLFIAHDVSDNSFPKVKKLTANTISDYVFGKITSDSDISSQTVGSEYKLEIKADAVESAMLNPNVISGQSNLTSATLHDDDEFLVYDSSATSLKKIKKSELLSGATSTVDFSALTNVDPAPAGSEILINDNGTNKKTSISNIVNNRDLNNIVVLDQNTPAPKTISPNTLVLLSDKNQLDSTVSSVKYDITLSTSGAQNGDKIIVKKMTTNFILEHGTSDSDESIIKYIKIDDNYFYQQEITGSGLEFVFYSNSWLYSGRKGMNLQVNNNFDITLSNEQLTSQNTFLFTNQTSNILNITLPRPKDIFEYLDIPYNIDGNGNTSSKSGFGTTDADRSATESFGTITFLIGSSTKDVVFHCHKNAPTVEANPQDRGIWSAIPATAGTSNANSGMTGKLEIKNVKQHNTITARLLMLSTVGGNKKRPTWKIEHDVFQSHLLSLSELSDVNWDPNDSSKSSNTVLVSKTNSLGQIYGEKLTSAFMQTVDTNGNNGAITSNVITKDAIIESKIADEAVTFSKMKKLNTYTILGNVDPANPASSTSTHAPSEIKVYDNVDTHQEDVKNNVTAKHSAIYTAQAVRDYVNDSLAAFNITSTSANARRLIMHYNDSSTMTQQLVDTDIGKTTYVDWLVPHSQTDGLYAFQTHKNYLESPVWTYVIKAITGSSSKAALAAKIEAKRLDLPSNSDFVIHMPRVSSDSNSGYAGLGAGSILQIAVTSRQTDGGGLLDSSRSIVLLPHPDDPKPGFENATTYDMSEDVNAVFMTSTANDKKFYDWGNFLMLPYSGKSTRLKYYSFELIREAQSTGPDGSTITSYSWLYRK